jgi:hypothetical protein
MAIFTDDLKELGVTLKQTALQKSKTVNDTFIIELANYAEHAGVNVLDVKDKMFVLATIGNDTVNDYGELTPKTIRKTIEKRCKPTSAYDLCSGTAKGILVAAGRIAAVKTIDNTIKNLMDEWSLDV